MAAPLSPISQHSRRSRVAEALRAAITNGRYLPGYRLIEVEVELASQLGTSRAPVREALRQLEVEGLVVSYPYRGTEVAAVSQEEIEEVLVPIRMTLERFAFTQALPKVDAGLIAELEQLIADMRADAGDADALAAHDVRFHELVIQRSGQTNCLQVWRTIEPRVRAYFRRDAPGARFAVRRRRAARAASHATALGGRGGAARRARRAHPHVPPRRGRRGVSARTVLWKGAPAWGPVVRVGADARAGGPQRM